MHKLYTTLRESHRFDEGVVGVFFYINGEVQADTANLRDADTYGGFYNYGSHYEAWDDIYDLYRRGELVNDYGYYPRGRVVFDRNLHKYILYIDPVLNTPKRIQKIADEFGLSNGGFYVDTDDEHYSHDQPNDEVI